jgi:tetratricopeptide (TPR) repeat protein
MHAPQLGVTPAQITGYKQADEWFTAEQAVLITVIDHAATQGFDTHAWQLSWAISDFLYQRGRWHEWAAIQQTALAIASRLGDLDAQARTYHSLANAYTYLGDAPQAIDHYQHALDLYRAVSNDEGQARVHDGLGWAYRS